MRALRLLPFGATLLFAASASAQAPAKFPFQMPWDDASPSIISAADLNPAPLAPTSRISVKGGHFFDATGRRVRFLGTNLTGTANFSRPEEAAKFAARMHKLGINCVRLHHMDASWANPNIFGANRDDATASNAQVSPQSLDLLDSTVAQLKQNGVYVDLNLHVARAPVAADGFPEANKLPELGKVVAYFDPQFIAEQKDYARQILNHKNPYTGQKWADDPVVALVELNNEDTLVGEAWSDTLQKLPTHYRSILSDGWNRFLKVRYVSTAALRQSWNAPLGTATTPLPNLLRNGQFGEGEGGTQGWYLETQENATGQLSVRDIQNPPATGPTGRALHVAIGQLPSQNWKLQLHQTGLNLKSNTYYTLGYWIRADSARTASNYFALDQDPWTQIGGQRNLALTPNWQYVRTVFRTGTTIPNHTRLSLTLGESNAPVDIADLRLSEGAQALVPADQTLENGTLDLPPAQGSSPAQARDWIEYLSAIETAYVSTMRDTIRNECGFKGPIACSQVSYGGFAGVVRENTSDWTDMHAYWQHPSFPGRAWDASNWNIGNKAMLDDPNGGTLTSLATARVEGKPFLVSEYNHPAPNDYAGETVPLILSYAAAQDWDGVFLFSWNGDRDNWNSNKIRGFFDMDSDPNKTTFLPIMARAFLSGNVAPIASQTTLTVPQSQLLALATGAPNLWDNIPSAWRTQGLGLSDVLNSRVGINLSNSGTLQLARTGARSARVGNPSFDWGFQGNKGHLLVDSPSVKALVGQVAGDWAGNFWQLGPLNIENARTSNGWMSLVCVAHDGLPLEKSNSLIVAALNRAENENMTWNANRTSVGSGWGDGPTLLETPAATLDLQTSAARASIWKLDATGKQVSRVPFTLKDGHLRFSIAPTDSTPWYEVSLTPSTTPQIKQR